MRLYKLLIVAICIASSSDLFATNSELYNFSYETIGLNTEHPKLRAIFTLSWKNSWHNSKNHDAVWLYFKIKNENSNRSERHLKIIDNSLTVIEDNGTPVKNWSPKDRNGIAVYPAFSYRGDILTRLQIDLDLSNLEHSDLTNYLVVSIPTKLSRKEDKKTIQYTINRG